VYSEIISNWERANPATSSRLGIHTFDHILPDYSEEFRLQRIIELKRELQYLETLTPVSQIEIYEWELVKFTLERELFSREILMDYKNSLVSWIYPLMRVESSITARNYASVDERLRIIIEFEKSIPDYLNKSLEIIDLELPKAKLLMGISFLSGCISYFKDTLISFVTQAEDEKLIHEWSEVNISAIEAMEKFTNILKTQYLPRAHDNFKLGKDKFLELLKNQEGVELTVEKLLLIGENDLERNYKALLSLANDKSIEEFLHEIKIDYPNPENLISESKEMLSRMTKFVKDNDLISVPNHTMCEVINTPKAFRSFAFAAMNTPGPFELPEASEAYYWITPPAPEWDADKTHQYMQFFNRGFLEYVSVHEVMPGHFLQLLKNQEAESKIMNYFAWSTSMIEGWAHYTEEMMHNYGYSDLVEHTISREKLHAGQLLGALMRNCRYVAAIKMHCFDMTVNEAKELFMNKGFMPEPNAQIEANRGTVDSMYLNYTLGKLMIMKLRDDYQKEKGEDYSIKEFHDRLLSYGSPPITVVRKLMLENAGNSQDVL